MKFRSTLTILALIVSAQVALARQTMGNPRRTRLALTGDDKRKDKERNQQAERTIAADPNVAVYVCVMSGKIKVHGWDRNEVRAKSNDAAQIEFRRPAGTLESEPARKLNLIIADPAAGPGRVGSCQS